MAHEVENMFSVAVTPWHGLGKVVIDAPSIDDVLKLAGLDWKVTLENLYLGYEHGCKTAALKAIVRDTDKQILGYATGERYTPFQNTQALDFFRPFHDSGEAKFETAGSLRNGEKVWILAHLKQAEMEIVKGDVVRKYLLLSNSHDGKTSIRVGFTPIRVVCANTLAMAHSNEESKLLRVFHGKNTQASLKVVQDIVNAGNASFDATLQQYKALANNRSIVQADVKKYVRQVFYNDKVAEHDREQLAQDKLTERITELFQTGYGSDISGVRGSAWGLYNAVTQYLSYDKGRDQNVRLDNLWFGSGINLNEKALEHALAL